MEIKRAQKNPDDFYIKEYITTDSNVAKRNRKIDFYDLSGLISC